MPPRAERDVLTIPRGYRSPEVASFMRQLDLLTTYLEREAPRLTVAELEWQPAPGMNSIGMLLAHIAIVEVWWVECGLRGVSPFGVDVRAVLDLARDDDGIPLSPRGRHPEPLRGRGHAFYRRQLARARAHLRRAVRGMSRADLERPRRRVRRDGVVHVYDARWVLFHLVEHFAGHFGQILMLRHAWRARRRRSR